MGVGGTLVSELGIQQNPVNYVKTLNSFNQNCFSPICKVASKYVDFFVVHLHQICISQNWVYSLGVLIEKRKHANQSTIYFHFLCR